MVTKHLDLSRPVALMLMGIMGHIADDAEAYSIVGSLMDRLPNDSFLVLRDATATSTVFSEAQDAVYVLTEFSGEVLRFDRDVESGVLEFRQAVEDVILKTGGGPGLRRAMTRLMKHPRFRDAHGTDDHFMAAMFVAGLVGDFDDVGTKAVMPAESWELTNMCNSQFTFGGWQKGVVV